MALTDPREIAQALDRLEEYRQQGRSPSSELLVEVLDGEVSTLLHMLDGLINILGPLEDVVLNAAGFSRDNINDLRNYWVVERDLHAAVMGR